MSAPRVHFSMDSAQGRFGPCALTIGNFGGVHRGHQALLKTTCDYARDRGLRPAVLTFHPHPAVFVAPHRVPELICSLEDRIRLLRETGAECILVLPFSEHLARFTPEEFVSQILVKGLHTRAVIVGENFRFGHRQAGNNKTLQELGEVHEFATQFLPCVTYRGEVVSSSAVRKAIDAGNVSRAGRLLGRCFFLEGDIVKGHGIGSQQTVPTLNLLPPKGQIIPRGVYITETFEPSSGHSWPSITNVGTRPTFDGNELTVETFLLAPLDGPSPTHIQVRFRRFVRNEQHFADAAALKAQILVDVGRAKAFWRRVIPGTA